MEGINEEILECPFCASEHIRRSGEFEPCEYYCEECDRYFTRKDVERENMRHELSALISGHDCEENQIPVNTPVFRDSFLGGFSTNDDLVVCGVFEDHEGIIWFSLEGFGSHFEFDNMDLVTISNVIDYIKENY